MNPSNFQTAMLSWIGALLVVIPAVFVVVKTVVTQLQDVVEQVRAVKTGVEDVTTSVIDMHTDIKNGLLQPSMMRAVTAVRDESTIPGSVTVGAPTGLDSRVQGNTP